MAGIENVAPGVSAGLAAQPLVTSAAPVVSTDAVEALSDAFRKGFVTADDITQRIGPIGQARKKAELQLLTEQGSPNAQAARAAALQEATARAQLGTAQATAAGPLVAPTAELASATIAKQKSDILGKSAVDAWLQYNPPIYKQDEDGNDTSQADLSAMVKGGSAYLRANAALQYAAQGLASQPAQEKDPKTGQLRVVQRNSLGEDVTPVPGNKAFEHYRDLRHQAVDFLFSPPKPPQPTVVKKSSAEASSGLPDIFPAAAGATPTSGASSIVTPTAAAPTVEPSYVPGTGRAIGPVPGSTEPEQLEQQGKLRDELRKEKAYEAWDAQKGFANSFDTAAKHIDSIPIADQRSGKVKMNTLDLSLAESLIKLYDPTAAIREFKWEKMSDKQPVQEQLKAWKSVLLRTGTLTPEARSRLIDLGYDTVAGKEKAAQTHINRIGTMATKYGFSPGEVLTDDDIRVAKGDFLHRQPGAATAPSGEVSGTVGGRQLIQIGPNQYRYAAPQ